MLSQITQKKIRSKLKNIYQPTSLRSEIDLINKEIIQIIRNFNIKNSKKNKIISEKTTMVICYGDSLQSNNQKYLIKNFQNFYQKKLKKYFDTIHFLPFYPSSSDSGFAVKDHYKVDNKIGTWSDIRNISKKCNIMADIVINHSSARGLWFKNFLKEKRPGKNYFLTVGSKFNTSKVVRLRCDRLSLETKWYQVY